MDARWLRQRRPGRRRIGQALTVLLLAAAAAGVVFLPRRVLPSSVRVGVSQIPPYNFWTSDGRPAGFSVEILNEAALRRGVRLEWIRATEGADRSLGQGVVDVWPAMGRTDERLTRIYITRPWIRDEFCLLSSAAAPVRYQDGVRGKTVSMVNGQVTLDRCRRHLPGVVERPAPSRVGAVISLCRGEADAAFIEMRLLDRILLRRPPECRGFVFNVDRVPGAVFEMGIGAATPAARKVADALRDEIDRLRADGTFAARLNVWSPFSSAESEVLFKEQEARHRTVLFASHMVAAAFVVGLLVWYNRRIVRARRAADRANAAKSEFVANMSHEIRTPMSGILSAADLLLGMPIDASARDYVLMIRSSGKVLLELLNDMLDLKKIEAGKLELEKSPFAVRQCLGEVVKVFRPQAHAKGLLLETATEPEVPEWVLGDPLRVRQVLSNLVSNAVKFTARGAVLVRVSVAAGAGAPRLRFGVADTGAGVGRGAQTGLFEPFHQGDASITKRFGGTGLGLAVAKALVGLMGGTIGVESQDGSGSVFWFELPLTVASGPAEGTEDDRPAGVPILRSASPARVLLVEDNAINRRVGVDILRRHGFQVDTAGNGLEAVESVKRGGYDLVFMDCFMPDLDGYEATRRIRAAENDARHTPIVALTAAVLPSERERAKAAGMDDFLAKPIEPAELERVLGRWVAAPK